MLNLVTYGKSAFEFEPPAKSFSCTTSTDDLLPITNNGPKTGPT